MADNTLAVEWLESRGAWCPMREPQAWCDAYSAHDVVGALLPNDDNAPETVRSYAQYQLDEAIDRAGGKDAVTFEATPGVSGIVGDHKNKLVCLWKPWLAQDPDAMDGAQKTGDCVSWGTRCAIDSHRTLKLWQAVARDLARQGEEVTAAACMAAATKYYKRQATAVLYMGRGHNGQGASPPRISDYSCKMPICFEEDYGGKWDFTNYGSYVKLGMNNGRSGAPRDLVELLREKNRDAGAKKWKLIRDPEAGLDAMANGYPAHLGSQMGVANRGDPVSVLKGSWSHDMGVVGFDSRAETIRRFGDIIVFMDQSWGPWNRVTDIPEEWKPWGQGMFAIRFRDWARHVSRGQLCVHVETTGVESDDDPTPWEKNPWYPIRPSLN